MSVGNREYGAREHSLMSSGDKSQSGLPSVEEAKERFLQQALSCPLCKTPPEQLSWVYLVIPQWACKNSEETEGWVTMCDRCKLQVDFFVKKS